VLAMTITKMLLIFKMKKETECKNMYKI